MTHLKFLLLLLVILIPACRGRIQNAETIVPTTRQLAEINREMVIKERERIESYILRKNLDMESTSSGLWYSLLVEGTGDRIETGDRIVLDYRCSLLDGTQIYSGDKDGYINMVVGKSDVPPGITEGVKFLATGAEAIFILPSYLAYGLTGDRIKIPSHATLVYWVKVVGIY